LREGERWRNDPSPERYLASSGETSTSETLDAETLLRERIMLGLRMREGLDLDASARDLGLDGGWTDDRRQAAAKLESRGRLAVEGSRARIPRSAWLWTDDTAARLM
jgi:coproporphyrinogen III oxidase-like Fe-S oxidoreductase